MVLAFNLYVAVCCTLIAYRGNVCFVSFDHLGGVVVRVVRSGVSAGLLSEFIGYPFSHLYGVLSFCEPEQGVDLVVLIFVSVCSGLSSDSVTRRGGIKKNGKCCSFFKKA